jgi:hypothetical protein
MIFRMPAYSARIQQITIHIQLVSTALDSLKGITIT